MQFTVDESLCTRCRQCVRDCPARVIEQRGKTVPTVNLEKGSCIQCQHCLAVCPTGALSIFGKDPADSLPLTDNAFPDLESMELLLRGRRSVRQYRDENVDPALLRRLLAALAHAPTGVNSRMLTFTVIDDRAVMRDFQQRTMAALTAAAAEGRTPPHFAYLQAATSWKYEYAVQLLFRTAPHALIVSAPPTSPCPREDIASTLACFDLLAHSAGLGSVWWGMLSMTLLVCPELKLLLGLPEDHHFYGMLFGLPAVNYARTVQRDDAIPVQRVTLP